METERLEQIIKDNALFALRLAILWSEKLTNAERLCFDNFIINYMEDERKIITNS